MKKTRRAAAVWMTMSLALSTIFGNTAWGEVLQETGGNRCTHVHTAECYGDLDETATPSQIGELEPAKCTHVCSEETGCIQNIKNWGVLSTPSNADDSTVNPGTSTADDSTVKPGTTTRVDTQTKTKNEIHSWTWYDPEEILIGGKLELTGVTEEAQPSFEEVTEYLPQAIIAQVGERDVWEEKNLQIANWTCAEYVQDEKGLWPLEGNYEFTAELPDGYGLADGVDALVVEVSVAGDQTAMMVDGAIATIVDNSGKEYSLYLGSNGYYGGLSNGSPSGVSLEIVNGEYKITLNNANLRQIYLGSGKWTVELRGSNTVELPRSKSGIAFHIGTWAEVIISGEGSSLKAAGNLVGAGFDVGGKLTIESGTISASATQYTGKDLSDDVRISGIKVAGELNINGGSITTTGSGRYGVFVGGTFQMSGGELTANGDGMHAILVDDGGSVGNFKLLGGTIKATANNGSGFAVASDYVTIKSGTLITDRVLLDNRTMTIEYGGTLQVDRLGLKESGKLINRGKLIVNGDYDGGGTVVNEEGGTISGTGSVPDSGKQNPGEIGVINSTLNKEYTNEKIDIQDSAKVTKPNQNVELSYSIDEDNSDGIGTIDDKTGKLAVEKIGTFVIQVTTEKTGIYKPADPVEITLTVTPAKFPESWNLEIIPVRNVIYNGSTGYKAAMVTASSIPSDVEVTYKYQVARTTDSTLLEENQWQQTCPTIANVSESGQHVFVKVITDNYESKVFCSNSTTNIINRSFTNSVAVTIDSSVYNNKLQNPKIKALENWKGVLGSELTEGVDYVIDHWENDNGQAVKKLEDAGTYTAYLLGMGNYDGSLKTATFTIEKCKLKSQMTGGPLVKVYDGTTNITEEQNVFVQLYGDSGIPDLQDIRADRVEYAYQSADVGEHYIDATIITLAGNKLDNYEVIKWKSSLLGTITPRDFKSMTVSAVPLTYDGTEQKPQINASVDTGLDKVSSSNAEFSYSMDGENFDSEVPSFKDPGTYTVYVKAEMDNFNPKTDKVEVIVQKAATPTAAGLSETYSYKETGEKRVKFTGIPEDCGMLGAVTAQIVSDEGQILEGSPAVDGSELVFKLKGSSREMIGKTAQIVVTVETQNYENIEIPVAVTLKADPSDSDSENGSSSSDDSDYNDSKTTAPKLSDVRSGNAANSAANNVTKDSKKGYWSNAQGIITGADNQVTNDGYSHWIKDSRGWWLRYSDGSYPKGSAGEYHWEKINGRWWAFGADGYLSTGWIYDTFYQGWFYMDANQGMLTGWQFIDGKWYYLNPVSDGTSGIMYAKKRTPDGWLVKEDGSWDEEAGR